MVDRNEPEIENSERPGQEDEESRLPESGPAINEDDQEGGLPEEDSDGDEDGDEDELEKAREHVDPTRGDKQADGGDRVSTHEGGNPQE